MFRKFVGDKTSLEARSTDGKLWDVTVYDRGHVSTFNKATAADLARMAAGKRLTVDTKS